MDFVEQLSSRTPRREVSFLTAEDDMQRRRALRKMIRLTLSDRPPEMAMVLWKERLQSNYLLVRQPTQITYFHSPHKA